MAIVRWRPMRHLFNLENQIERMFERFSDNSFNHEDGGIWSPSTDVSETEDGLILSVELPGMKKEDMKITVEDNLLAIQGEKRQIKEEKGGNCFRVERSYGAVSRFFMLPSAVLAEQIKANYEDGVLKVVLPKVQAAKPKEIAVKVG
ncbi:MAG: hypothetical protein A2Z27_02550 [candidate division Zixibacteria bacterium RBG_16_50_21]|nr:MAG: hypothetical protein A2Z27_02550 [candidate division Zixibacteria bacterium RBG_16_50_21]